MMQNNRIIEISRNERVERAIKRKDNVRLFFEDQTILDGLGGGNRIFNDIGYCPYQLLKRDLRKSNSCGGMYKRNCVTNCDDCIKVCIGIMKDREIKE